MFLGQISLISPDVALLALFIWGLLGVLEKRSALLLLCSIFLAIISLRGMMAVLALYFFQVVHVENPDWKKPAHWLRSALPFVPAGLLALAFLGYHAWAKSWVGFHADSPWRESFTVVGFKGMLKNGFVLAWRIADYGRVFLVMATLWLGYKQFKVLKSNPFFLSGRHHLAHSASPFFVVPGRKCAPVFVAFLFGFAPAFFHAPGRKSTQNQG